MAEQAEPELAVGDDGAALFGIARLAGERIGNGIAPDREGPFFKVKKIIE